MSFRFKQFFVEDSRCAMKVGTDGVLLGAWTPIWDFKFQISDLRILDVGTGSGLVALMLAQRFPNAHIDAIDIDEAAVEQARENAERAQTVALTENRIRTYHARLQDWQPETKYDLIVSNPPYFQNSLKNPDKGRELARHTDSLRYDELLCHSARLMAEDGQLAIILPAESEQEIRQMAATHSLYCTHVTRVYSKASKPARRVLMVFAKVQTEAQEDTLILEDEKGGRSAAYSELCKEFYL